MEQDERIIQTHKAREPDALWLIFFYFDQTKVANLLYLPGSINRIGTHIPREQTVPRRADKANHEYNAGAEGHRTRNRRVQPYRNIVASGCGENPEGQNPSTSMTAKLSVHKYAAAAGVSSIATTIIAPTVSNEATAVTETSPMNT